MGTKVPGSES